jgi:YspA, cpYpsA-related SLOG family
MACKWISMGNQRIFGRKVTDSGERVNRHKPIAALVHGGTPGPELFAAQWAAEKGLRVACCAADWVTHQELGAVERNRRMIEYYQPDGVIVFLGAVFGDDLAARAGAAKIPVMRPVFPQAA